jgi:hypothetical protein
MNAPYKPPPAVVAPAGAYVAAADIMVVATTRVAEMTGNPETAFYLVARIAILALNAVNPALLKRLVDEIGGDL